MGRLERRIALITGGASGLGKAMARRFAAEGARVVISDVQSTVGESTASETGFLFLEQDVRDEPRWVQIVSDIEARYGRLDILVNNAGILGSVDAGTPENTPLDDWRRIFAVNVEGVFLGCRAAVPAMRRAGGGSIINLSSIAGLRASPYATAYGASKAAVRQLTKSVAQHCAEQKLNVRCNSIHPGDVRTPLWDKRAAEAARLRAIPIEHFIAEEQADCPMGDFTVPEDVAAAAAFLASDDSRHITGSMLIIDGGTTNCETYRANSQRSVPGRAASASD